jgi:DNA polymerase II small subunit/DNA polymerase delta subunit B
METNKQTNQSNKTKTNKQTGLVRATNPTEADLGGGLRVLATGGQNVADAAKYCDAGLGRCGRVRERVLFDMAVCMCFGVL